MDCNKRIANVNALGQLCDALRARQTDLPAEGRKLVRLCMGASCIASGAQRVREAIEQELAAHGLDRQVEIVETGCMGPCSGGPVLVIGDVFYEQVQPEDAADLVSEHLGKGKMVNRLTHRRPDGRSVPHAGDMDFFKRQTKIVLRNCGQIDPRRIEDYIARDGYQALAKVLSADQPDQVLAELKASGLRGRGGAGFPTWRKWKFTREAAGDVKFVVCNADEGDPGAFMDRSVLEGDPHSIIEGMAIAAHTIGAAQGYVYVRAEYPLAVERLTHALGQARERGLLGKDVLGTGFDFELEIRMGSGAFVCGEETALLRSIEGNRGEPRPRPPFPAQCGLWGKPTLLNNVETYANIAPIVLNGGEWYASRGTDGSRGTKVFALAGAIKNSGLVEVPIGMSLGDLIYDIGGGIPDEKQFKAAQIGGPSGGCIPPQHLNVPLDYESLSELGAIMGSGGLIVMNEDTCMVDVARYFIEFVQEESCGKCVPCRVGTKRMLEILERICDGRGEEADVERLIELGEIIKDTSLCGLGQTAPNPVLSTIRHFGNEYIEHIRDRRCRAGVCPSLVNAPCSSACPANVDIPGYVSLVAERRYAEALRLHRERNPLAAVCSRVCFHTCEEKCRRATIDAPVSIRGIKRFMADQEVTFQVPAARENEQNAKRSVVVVGAGPAGLSCAYFLARLGYQPKVYEAEPRPGGMLVQAIPAYRLPREIVAREVRMIEQLGVEIHTEMRLGSDFTLRSLRAEGCEAVFLGVGAPHGVSLGITGDNAAGITDALSFLRTYNLRGSVPVGRQVVVIGGGNSAIDAARTALRLGADRVTVVYRRSREVMPAYREEIDEALAEGVELRLLTAPVEIVTENKAVAGVRCVPMQLGAFDRSGRRRPERVGEAFVIPADHVLAAIGQSLDLKSLSDGVQLARRNNVFIDVDHATGQTSQKWIFAGGDAVTGPSSVVEAVAAGERAARGIDMYLTGDDHAFWRDTRPVDTYFDPEAEPVETSREKLRLIPVERRRHNFDEVEQPWQEAIAIRQAKRCLRCDYGRRECEGTYEVS
ncbi:MAG: NADH-ubiquinone oxidoreductase-F iron-sulfur binding region domain-containing protein [Thermoguttaceae bacterium]|jgi:NADH-quinone oxidoreductase subunit F|nr:NADH-ubiquinone oxidoreductase-F iron-sulfur binding region domain-containing protein [Thermoguttaceae bacterium]